MPAPLENKLHSFWLMVLFYLLMAQQIKKAYNFLCTSNKDLEILVNIILVML